MSELLADILALVSVVFNADEPWFQLLPVLGLWQIIHRWHRLYVLSYYVHGTVPPGDLTTNY